MPLLPAPLSSTCRLDWAGALRLRWFALLFGCGTLACGQSFFAREPIQAPHQVAALAAEPEPAPFTPVAADLGQGCSPRGCLRAPPQEETEVADGEHDEGPVARKPTRFAVTVWHPLRGKGKDEIERLVRSDLGSLGSMVFGSATRGGLLNGVRLPDDPRWVKIDPPHVWGTSETVNYLVSAIDAMYDQFPDSHPLFIGDISQKQGGYLRPHISHQSGKDVDVSYFYTHDPNWYVPANAGNLDRPRTWALIRSLITRTDVHYIFIDRRVQRLLRQYAESIGEDQDWLESVFHGAEDESPIIVHEPGHATHMHVRFYNPIAEETARRCYPALLAQRKVLPMRYSIPHKAKRGDTLIGLAKRYKTTVAAIMQANNLTKKALRADKTYLIPRQGAAGPAEPTPLPPRRLPPARPPTGAVASR
jgi:penicillin-insensitive murein endopeptidase